MMMLMLNEVEQREMMAMTKFVMTHPHMVVVIVVAVVVVVVEEVVMVVEEEENERAFCHQRSSIWISFFFDRMRCFQFLLHYQR